MGQRFKHRRTFAFMGGSGREVHEAELFFRELMGEEAYPKDSTGLQRPATSKRITRPFQYNPLEQTDFLETPESPKRKKGSSYTADDARSAADNVNPNYRHLNVSCDPQVFTFTHLHLERLCRLNYFDFKDDQERILFGLRGCKIVGCASAGNFHNSVQLSESIPDHFTNNCVLGVWNRPEKKLAVFTGSTVPNWGNIRKHLLGKRKANMLLTGRYLYRVGKHKKVPGAFQLRGKVVVLRSTDNLVYETTDEWDPCNPADNIHPAASSPYGDFGSAGCQTVTGSYRRNTHRGSWGKFRERAGLDPEDSSKRNGELYDYVLLTGREARLVSSGQGARLNRLRFGSKGKEVESLQEGLRHLKLYNGPKDGEMGPATVDAYMKWQKAEDNGTADGIVTPSTARKLFFNLIRRRFSTSS